MIQKIAAFLLMTSMTLAAFVYATQPVLAANDWTEEACNNGGLDDQQKAALGCEMSDTAPTAMATLINGVLTLIGIIAVLVIVIGGQRFISQGDPSKIAAAKGMIIYGVVGVLVALLAFAIVNFVVSGVFSQ